MGGTVAAGGPPWYVARRFADPGDLAAALRDVSIEFVPLQAGPQDVSLGVMGLGGVLLQRVTVGAHVSRGQVAPDSAVIEFCFDDGAPAAVNGVTFDRTQAVLLGPGAEHHTLVSATVDCGAFSLPVERLAALLDLGGLDADPPAGGAMRVLPAPTTQLLRRAMGDILAEAAALGGEPVALGAFLAAAAGSFGDVVAEAFARAEQPAPASRATRSAIRIVDSAEAHLRAHPSRPIHVEELCAVLGVSPRRIHQAFAAACGMSPQAYLRRRRLLQVHAVLKAGGGDAGLVKSAALAHGFWHLGRFAQAYRAQFGQAPSETLATARIGGGFGTTRAAGRGADRD